MRDTGWGDSLVIKFDPEDPFYKRELSSNNIKW